MTWKRVVLGALLIVTLLAHRSDACGPSPSVTIFTYERFPAMDLTSYVAGDLGVVRPTYWHRFLFMAYRYFNGNPLTAEEQAVIAGPDASWEFPMRDVASGSQVEWQAARARVPGIGAPASPVSRYRPVPGSDWQQIPNCNDSGFLTAADTLNRRIDEFGLAAEGVRRWVMAQDQVFANCSDGVSIPPEPEPDLPAVFAADRRYQIAAAHFYSLQLVEAQRRFAAIAEDRTSQWRGIASYMIARCFLRRASLEPRSGYFDRDYAADALNHLRQILRDPELKSMESAAQSLLGKAWASAAPDERLAVIANTLSKPGARDFKQDYSDYQTLIRISDKKSAREKSDLVDWVVTFQAGEFEHAIERWRSTQSPAWLVAALAHAPADHAAAGDLRAAAAATPSDSPSWATLTFYRMKQLGALDPDKARTELDGVLTMLPVRGRDATRNVFLGQRFALARDLEDALRFASRRPVAHSNGEDGESLAGPMPDDAPDQLFAGDVVRTFNQGLPIDVLARAARSSTLPSHLQAQLTLAAWTRAALLQRWDIVRGLTADLGRHFPATKQDGGGWLAATTDEDRKFAAAYLLLHHPGMQPHLRSGLARKTAMESIDTLKDNWWCNFSIAADLDADGYWRFAVTNYLHSSRTPPTIEPAVFLSGTERAALVSEWMTLRQTETAPNYLAAIVTAYATRHRGDPRSPEALHLAIRATRRGCTDANTGVRSRAAFRLLHRGWPQSEWARRTPYWFN